MDAAKQAQAGADVEQQGRFLGLRHQRRVLQQGHRYCVQRFGFEGGIALDQACFWQQHQHAAAAHAHLHAGGARQR
jgi:hypothetical protein